MTSRGSSVVCVLAVLAAFAVAGSVAGSGVSRASFATFTVNSTADAGDANPGDGVCETLNLGECTLRAAIEEANANIGTESIEFNVPDAGPHTIQPTSALPTITDPVVIDGTTEPDFAGTPILELDGSLTGAGVDGLKITGGNSAVRGLIIDRFDGSGIVLDTSGGNVIEGNYIGTDISGIETAGNERGVFINNAPGNTIGGTTGEARNVISGNDGHGVEIQGSGAAGNFVLGNHIGTDLTGAVFAGNMGSGVYIDGAPNNLIGGTAPGARNVISGNLLAGVEITGSGAAGNQVQGNFIGPDITGASRLPNFGYGVAISGAPNNVVGGTAPEARNIIAGNKSDAIHIAGLGAAGNQVQGNFIGTDLTGAAALAPPLDTGAGVVIADASNNIVGGTTGAAGNVISGNELYGVLISGEPATGNQVQGNLIGVDVTGTMDVGNYGWGVMIDNAPGNTIGGMIAGARNVISGNDWFGVTVYGHGATGNVVHGNFIGTDVTGTAALGNASMGVAILSGASGNAVGGATAQAGNVISGNGAGVFIGGSDTTENRVQGNRIGIQADASGDLGNNWHAVVIDSGASGNAIGGTTSEAGNTIAYSLGDGVRVQGAGTTGNSVRGNSIHDNGGLGINNVDGGNAEMAPPVITATGSTSGTACPNCIVDVYSDNGDEGGVYHGFTTASGSGDWTFGGAVAGPNITATATDSAGNTSEFSAPFVLSLVGDVDCDGDVDAVDALFILQYVVAMKSGSDQCPPPLGSLYLPAADVDNSTTVDAVDALFILQCVLNMPPGNGLAFCTALP